MVLPSVAGVDEAWLLSLWIRSKGLTRTTFVQRISPFLRSRQSSSRCCFSFRAVTRKMRSSQTIGEACPLPGSGVFHSRFSVVLQVTGTFFSMLVPSPRGPLQPGQFSAKAAALKVRANAVIRDRQATLPPRVLSEALLGIAYLHATRHS